MSCLYEDEYNKNKCNCLRFKDCYKCKFYKENTEENYRKYVLYVEADIKYYLRKLGDKIEK